MAELAFLRNWQNAGSAILVYAINGFPRREIPARSVYGFCVLHSASWHVESEMYLKNDSTATAILVNGSFIYPD